MSANPKSARDQRRRFAEQGGFTLLEVLVAFTVMSILLSVLFRTVVLVRAGSVAFEDHTHLEIVARDVLEDMLARRDLKSGSYAGEREGRRWTLSAKTIDLTEQLPRPADTPKPASGAIASQDKLGQSAALPARAPQDADKTNEPTWATQRLTVRVQSSGQPLEIETIRLVRGP